MGSFAALRPEGRIDQSFLKEALIKWLLVISTAGRNPDVVESRRRFYHQDFSLCSK